jgi:hypothetical protein
LAGHHLDQLADDVGAGAVVPALARIEQQRSALALRCLPLAPESWRAKREAFKTKCDALKTMWLDRPWIYPYDAGHPFLNRPFD